MRAYIIDIDGTILDGERELNGAGRFIHSLQENSVPFLLATNSIRSAGRQVKRFEKIGLHVETGAIYSPVDSINTFIRDQGIERAFTVGSEAEISQVGARQSSDDPELIILLDFEKSDASYSDLQWIVELAGRGIDIITASRSPYYLKEGRTQLDTGAFVQLIESVTESSIPVFGKPSKAYFDNALSLLESKSESTIVIGDDWKTDIVGAREAGLGSVLVASGKYREGDEKEGRPDRFIRDFSELMF